jgi:predicted  nucleic acid-binding Zn-ribbon protein
MKQTIGWHKECLKNMTASTERYADELERAKFRYKSMVASCEKYKAQIAEAEKRGKDAFDSDRFMGGRG